MRVRHLTDGHTDCDGGDPVVQRLRTDHQRRLGERQRPNRSPHFNRVSRSTGVQRPWTMRQFVLRLRHRYRHDSYSAQRNDPRHFSCNVSKHCPILLFFFGIKLTEKLGNQKLFISPTHLTRLCACPRIEQWTELTLDLRVRPRACTHRAIQHLH